MHTVREVYDYIDSFAPFSSAVPGDNSGLLVGGKDRGFDLALLVLDVTIDIARRAQRLGAGLIISHHPLIYNSLRSLEADSAPFFLAANGINLICAHTNLDLAPGGTNDTFIETVGLSRTGTMAGGEGCVALCTCPPELTDPHALALAARDRVGAPVCKLMDSGRTLKTVAVCCGSGGSFFGAFLASEADAYLTGDLKYSQAAEAAKLGRSLIDLGHFETERLILKPLAQKLGARFKNARFETLDDEKSLFLTLL